MRLELAQCAGISTQRLEHFLFTGPRKTIDAQISLLRSRGLVGYQPIITKGPIDSRLPEKAFKLSFGPQQRIVEVHFYKGERLFRSEERRVGEEGRSRWA